LEKYNKGKVFMRPAFLKEPVLEEFDFNQCPNAEHLTASEKLSIAKLYQEVVYELNTIEAYPGAKVSEEKRQAVIDRITPIIDSNPNLKYIFHIEKNRNYSTSIARECLRTKCDSIVESFFEDELASSVTDHLGRNLGMICAYEGHENLVLLALDNEKARRQQSKNGLNIGMICAKNKLVNATMKALDDDIAAAQQSADSETIGMICARVIAGDRTMLPAFEKAASNPKTVLIKDNQNRTLFDIAKTSSYAGATIVEKFSKVLLQAQLMQEGM
jgi:hypothetical protein